MKVYGVRMVLAAALAGALIAGVLTWRSHLQADAASDTCASTHKIVSTLQILILDGATRAELTKMSYYRDHPDEIKAAQDGAKMSALKLGAADCPATLPPPKGK